MRRRPPRSTQSRSSAASDVYKRQLYDRELSPEGMAAASHRMRITGMKKPMLFFIVSQPNCTASPIEKLFLAICSPLSHATLRQNLSLIHISEPTRLGMI